MESPSKVQLKSLHYPLQIRDILANPDAYAAAAPAAGGGGAATEEKKVEAKVEEEEEEEVKPQPSPLSHFLISACPGNHKMPSNFSLNVFLGVLNIHISFSCYLLCVASHGAG